MLAPPTPLPRRLSAPPTAHPAGLPRPPAPHRRPGRHVVAPPHWGGPCARAATAALGWLRPSPGEVCSCPSTVRAHCPRRHLRPLPPLLLPPPAQALRPARRALGSPRKRCAVAAGFQLLQQSPVAPRTPRGLAHHARAAPAAAAMRQGQAEEAQSCLLLLRAGPWPRTGRVVRHGGACVLLP